MGRWAPGTATRLRESALRLFVDRGYHNTTVDDVVADAGVTQRTFFRHFPDKEEVLFAEDFDYAAMIARGANEYLRLHADDGGSALGAARAGTHAMAHLLEPLRAEQSIRFGIVLESDALLGRQFVKNERWAEAGAKVLVDAGFDRREAEAATAIAATAMKLAYAEWTRGETDESLPYLVARTDRLIDELRG